MRETSFIDKVLDKIQKRQIAHCYNKEMTARDAAEELNISSDYVGGLFKEWDNIKNEDNRFIDLGDTYAEEQIAKNEAKENERFDWHPRPEEAY